MLTLQNVAKLYGLKVVLKQINCHFAAESITLLLGGNGAGKSSLLRILAGLSRPTTGTVQASDALRIGYVGHATFLYPQLTALENLRFWAQVYGCDTCSQKLLTLLQRVGLEAHAHERAGVFSRGMAQRLNLARVLMQPVDLLLLDEPCTGLDSHSQNLLRQEMLTAKQHGACVVVVSHDYAADSPFADRILALEAGRIRYDGTPQSYEEVLDQTTATAQAMSVASPKGLSPPPRMPDKEEEKKQATASSVGILTMAHAVWKKDILLTLARGSGLIQALLLGLLVLFMFSLAQGVGETLSAQSAAAVFWLGSVFCQVLIFNGLYAVEERCAARVGLLLAPAPVQGIWLGKALAGLLLLVMAQLLFLPAAIVFLGQQMGSAWQEGLLALVLVDIGICALGSLLGALAQGNAARESLLSILLFPLLIPLLLVGISVGAVTFGESSVEGVGHWLRLALAFDGIFIAAALFLFGFMYTGEDA